ncbi:extensin family protein [Methylocystis sp. SC2]|uniref:extensin-like domain-containing protein n=1 Tax=Methylocystis sp. (strain SC2) TaxID=187303 RepID=UPI0002F5F9E8|nr:extensin family protein [Methylocystis sp. SC2]
MSRELVSCAVEVALALALNVVATSVGARDAPSPPRRPAVQTAPLPEAKPSVVDEAPRGETESAEDCMAKLRAAGVAFGPAEAPAGALDGCAIEAPVRLLSVTVGVRRVALNAKPLLACGFALQFSDYVKNLLAPLGAGTIGASLVAIDTGSGYECRGRNRDNGGKLSAHAKGLALDIAGFDFSNGRTVGVDAQPDPQSTAYVKTLRRAACGWFTTVLGPGSDPYHASHLHFDIARHGSNDDYRICQ